MSTILISMAAAIVHSLAITGYLSILGCLTVGPPRSSVFTSMSLRMLLYASGIGSLFIAPAYLYGQFKSSITDEMLVAFGVAEIIGLIVLIFVVKFWNSVLANIAR